MNQTADETALLWSGCAGANGHTPWLDQHPGGAQGFGHNSPVFLGASAQMATLIHLKAAVVEDYKPHAVGFGPFLTPSVVQPSLMPA
jgi:hypothetical protein